MHAMQVIWRRIEAWLGEHAPELLEELLPGVEDEDIQDIETEIGMALPEDIKASFRIHNGSLDFFVDGWRLHNIDEMEQTWRRMNNQFRDSQEWWRPQWLPLAADGSGNLICLDLSSPTLDAMESTERKPGELFVFNHDDVDWRLAPSFQALLAAFADDLEAGHYHLDEFGKLSSAAARFLFHFTRH